MGASVLRRNASLEALWWGPAAQDKQASPRPNAVQTTVAVPGSCEPPRRQLQHATTPSPPRCAARRRRFTTRTTGTHTGTLKFGRAEYPATGRRIQGAPECCSYTFDEEGKVTVFTGGYVMDNRVSHSTCGMLWHIWL